MPKDKITDEPVELLAADAREEGDGKRLALAKVVAGLLGVSSDDIFRRAERERRRKGRVRNAIIATLAVLAVAAPASAVYAWQQLKTNEAFLTATLKTATEIVDQAVAQAEKYGVPRTATLTLLAKAEDLFDNMARLGRPTPELRYQKAWMLIQFARNYGVVGDTGKWRQRAEQARQICSPGWLRRRPTSPDYQRGLAAAQNETGNALMTQGDLAGALAWHFARALPQWSAWPPSDPSDFKLQTDLAVSDERIGDVLVALGQLDAALEQYRTGLNRLLPLRRR